MLKLLCVLQMVVLLQLLFRLRSRRLHRWKKIDKAETMAGKSRNQSYAAWLQLLQICCIKATRAAERSELRHVPCHVTTSSGFLFPTPLQLAPSIALRVCV